MPKLRNTHVLSDRDRVKVVKFRGWACLPSQWKHAQPSPPVGIPMRNPLILPQRGSMKGIWMAASSHAWRFRGLGSGDAYLAHTSSSSLEREHLSAEMKTPGSGDMVRRGVSYSYFPDRGSAVSGGDASWRESRAYLVLRILLNARCRQSFAAYGGCRLMPLGRGCHAPSVWSRRCFRFVVLGPSGFKRHWATNSSY
jgi:hypothetical protein